VEGARDHQDCQAFHDEEHIERSAHRQGPVGQTGQGKAGLPFRHSDFLAQHERLTEEVYQAIGLPSKESDTVVRTILDSIVRSLHTCNKVEIRGFGVFNTRQRGGRIGQNPKTGARIEVPPKSIPFFKASKELRELVEKT
jgi:integration host factor subunit beta